MRTLPFSLISTLIIFGCGEDLENAKTLQKVIFAAIEYDKLENRGLKKEKLYHRIGDDKPFTGWVKEMYSNGQIKGLVQLKDGKPNGAWIEWTMNGEKEKQEIYEAGEPDKD